MKKNHLAAVLAALLLCAGCAAQKEPPRAADAIVAATSLPFSCEGSLALQGLSQPVGVTVTKSAHGLVLQLTSPAAVAGLRLEFDEELTRVGYRELLMNLTEGDLPQQSVFAQLRDVAADLPPAPEQVATVGKQTVVSAQAGLTHYKMYWNADGTVAKSIELPDCGAVLSIEKWSQIP